MRRTNIRVIKLPKLITPTEAPGLSAEETEEINIMSYDYARRTALPTIRENIITPFSESFGEKTLEEAREAIGMSGGILLESYIKEHIFGNKKFVCAASPSVRFSYESILSSLKSFLENAVADSARGIKREGIRKYERDAYISLDYLLGTEEHVGEIERLVKERSHRFNKTSLVIKDAETGSMFPPDKSIREMPVYLDFKRFLMINEANAEDYYRAKSLYSRITAFLREFERHAMEKHGIPSEGLRERISVDYELIDGSGVRYLFFPKQHTEYGKIYSYLVGRKTKNITFSTGDLDIIKELASKGHYEFSSGKASIFVSTELYDENSGKIRIIREAGDIKDETEYNLLFSPNRVYVRIRDILNTLDTLTEKNTDIRTQIKIDFFAGIPEYLK